MSLLLFKMGLDDWSGADVTAQDVRDHRDYLVVGGAPAVVNRALASLSFFLSAAAVYAAHAAL